MPKVLACTIVGSVFLCDGWFCLGKLLSVRSCESTIKQDLITKMRWDIPGATDDDKDNEIGYWVREYSGTSKPRILSNALEAVELWSDINYNGTMVKFSLTTLVDVMFHRYCVSGDSVVGQFKLCSTCQSSKRVELTSYRSTGG